MEKKQLVKTIIAGILVIIMFITIIQTVVKVKKARRRARSAVAKQKVKPIISPLQPSKPVAKEEADTQAQWGQDPFTGGTIRSGFGKTTVFQLSGIVYNPKNPKDSYAIIDNFVVKEGDVVSNSNMKVSKIKEQEVLLSDGFRQMTLKLW